VSGGERVFVDQAAQDGFSVNLLCVDVGHGRAWSVVHASPAALWRVIEGIGGETGWYSFPAAGGIRGLLDRLAFGEGPVPLARRLAGSVLNLPFQGWLLPLKQRVNEWQLFPSPRVRFLVTLHEFTTRISPIIR
jgi:hypothetical protein